MSTITFDVIDTSCQQADQSFFPPSITLTGKSTTQIATVLGWSEFPGFVSSPPKKFKTVSWAGSSEQQLWYQGVQIGGARYDFGGIDQIDELGNITNNHTKILSVMCNGAQNRANIVGGVYPQNTNYNLAAAFIGYFGTNSTFYPNLFGPTELCSSGSIPYEGIGDQAAQSPFSFPMADLFGLWGSGSQGGQNSFMGQAVVTVQSNTNAASNDNGTSNVTINPYAIPLLPPGIILEQFPALETPQGFVPRPPDWGAGAQVVFTNAFSAALQDEYTDAEALAHAVVIQGNGTTAQNGMRTTGFVSQFTNVVYTLSIKNLIVGQSYIASVDLADLTSGTVTTVTSPFTATSATNTIIAPIPTPAIGHTVQVRNARIAFA